MEVKDKIEAVLDNLEYDFNTFEVDHFIRHIAKRRRRPIILKGFSMEPEMSALLARTDRADYIVYNERNHPILQTHSILHEIAHILLEHPGLKIKQVLSPELLALLPTDSPQGRLREAVIKLEPTIEEQEAEAFVLAIQRRLVKARRLNALTGPSSSIHALQGWVDSMAFTE